MGREMGTNMFAARHALMSVSEMFGGTLPRAITAFIADIGPVGATLEAAFPFAALALGAFLLLEHLTKLREAGLQLTQDQIKFGTAVQTAFNQLEQKLLQAQQRADEFRNDHLGALHKQLQLIDMQSMAELVHSFEEVAKAADGVMTGLKASWYEWGEGSAGAKHALTVFKDQYESLLAQGKDKEASDLLRGTRESAQKSLESIKQTIAATKQISKPGLAVGADTSGAAGAWAAIDEVKRHGLEKQLAAQQQLVGVLDAQLGIEQRSAELKKQDSANATRTTAGTVSAQQAAAARAAAESQTRMGEMAVQADRAVAEAQLAVRRGSVQQRSNLDLEFAQREYDVAAAGNAQQIAALDKLAKDYPVALKGLQDKALEISEQHAAKIAELTSKATIEQAAKDLAALEAGEREKIDATQQGSAARLAAIDKSIKSEESLNLQDTSFFRELLTQRVETAREMAEEEAKLKAEAGKQSADNDQKMGELAVAAERERMNLVNSARRVSEAHRVMQEQQAATAE